MKRILIILSLFASVTTFAQSPRIKLNQITKDTVKGSVLISSPSDSGMVYSRDFYIAYGADTVLILYGDTLGGVGGGFASVLTDGVTVTGDGTTGNELKVDTATVISTIKGLVDSLVNYVTLNGTETITGAKTFTTDLNIDAKIALNAGDNNIVIGDGAGASLVSGQALGNVLVGTSAGAVIDSGDYNVANGYQALFKNTTGIRNIANGYQVLYNNTTGYQNIANGNQALFSNTTSNNNLANGAFALYSLNSGSDNQAYGYEAGRYIDGGTALTNANNSLFLGKNTRASANLNSNEIVIGTNAIGNGSNSVTIGASTNELVVMKGRMELNDGGNSVFIGDDAGRVDDGTDNRNVAVGYQALYSNTTGYFNTANGYQALQKNTTGNSNIANGYQALQENTTGKNNIANGYQALQKNTTGNNNVANGYQALYLNETGGANIANGFQSLYSNTTGYFNTANGSYALYLNETGVQNTANGVQALYSNISGNNNIVNGFQALYLNETGVQNTANGVQSLYSNTTGDNNVANGYRALYSLSSGSDNQGYGYQAGRYLSDGVSVLDTANGSLFLGSSTRALANNSTNEIVIGTNAIGNGSNTITIGSSTTQSLHTRNYEFDIDQTVGGATDNYVLTYDSLDGQISLEPISLSGSATLDFGSTSSLNSSDLTITVTGAADGDVVSLGVPNASVNANTNYTAWVSAANTVTVRFNNYSLGAVDPASGTFKVKIFK